MENNVVYLFTAIHEFPEDIFTKEQRKNGAVILHAVCVSIHTWYLRRNSQKPSSVITSVNAAPFSAL